MDSRVYDLIRKERTCVLSILQEDGTPHAATVHFSHTEDPLKFFIQTSNKTLKAQPFLNDDTGKAAIVLGFSEEEWVTLQLHGDIRAVSDPSELEAIYKIHYAKNPDAEQYRGPNTVFLEFVPTWWRYTDLNTEPETILKSEY